MIPKFRVWDKKEKRFLSRTVYVANNQEIIYSPDGWEIAYLNYPDDIDVSLSTGLLDKNGKEAYAGDIVKWRILEYSEEGDEQVNEIRWSEKGGSFILWDNKHNETERLFSTGDFDVDSIEWFAHSWIVDWEIIGNIYENPELLKD